MHAHVLLTGSAPASVCVRVCVRVNCEAAKEVLNATVSPLFM